MASYEEAFRYCPGCGRETWHGREAADVFRAKSLTPLSHLVTVWTDLVVPWRCLDCGRRARGTPRPPAPGG